MNNIDGSKNIEKYNNKFDEPPKDKKNLINQLLPELFKGILSYINKENAEIAQTVNHLWNKETISTVQNAEFEFLTGFVNLLMTNLPEGAPDTVKVKLKKLSEDRKILHAVSLKQIKILSFGFKENLINILKDLTEEELKTLDEACEEKPEPFRNIFKIAHTYKILDSQLSDLQLAYRIERLLNFQCFDKAIETAYKISDYVLLYEKLVSIIKFLGASNKSGKALEIIYNPSIWFPHQVSKDNFKDLGISALSHSLILNGKSDEALNLMGEITNPSTKAVTLIANMDDLLEIKDYNGLIQIIKLISDHFSKYPESFFPVNPEGVWLIYNFNEFLQDLADKLANKDPLTAHKIISMMK